MPAPEKFFFLLFHVLNRNSRELRCIVIGILQNREPGQNLSVVDHLTPGGANHIFEAKAVAVSVIPLRSCELAEPDGHHFE